MFSVGSAMRVQADKQRRDNDIRDLYDRRPNMLLSELAQIVGVTVPELKEILMGDNPTIIYEETKTMYTLPHGFTIEQNKYLDDYWSLLCQGNFVFQGSKDECFIAFGGHLAGVGK